MQMQINHSLVLAVVSLGVFANAAPQRIVGSETTAILPAAPVAEDFTDSANAQLIGNTAVADGIVVKRNGGSCNEQCNREQNNNHLSNRHREDGDGSSRNRNHRCEQGCNESNCCSNCNNGGCCGGNGGGCGDGCGGSGCNRCHNVNQSIDNNQNINAEVGRKVEKVRMPTMNRAGLCGVPACTGGCAVPTCTGFPATFQAAFPAAYQAYPATSPSCGGCGTCEPCAQEKRQFKADRDNQNIYQEVDANQGLMANLPIDEFFGSETATQVVTQPVFFAAPTPTSSCGSKDEFNVINDVKFADSGFFKAKRSLGGLTRGAFGGMDEFNVINSVTFADREQQQFNNPCNYGCNPCYGQCRPNGKPKGAVAQNSSSQSSNRNRCAGDRFNNAEHSKQHSKRQMMDCSSDNQNIVQSIQNNQNVDAEILGNTGFANTRSFLSFLNKRDVGLIKGSPLARRNYQHNPTKNININKNLNKPQPPPCPVEITTTEYVPVVEKIPVAVPVTTCHTVTEIEKVPYTEFVVTYPTPTCQPAPIVNNYINTEANAASGAENKNIHNGPIAEIVEEVAQPCPEVVVTAPAVTCTAAPQSACGCDLYKRGQDVGFGGCGCNDALEEVDESAGAGATACASASASSNEEADRVRVVRPTRVSRPATTVVQPVVTPAEVIQPVHKVIQPIVEEHIKPVYSECTKAPIVNTCVEPCTKACCNGVARRDCGCPANFCGCPTKCDVVKPAVTETKAPIVNNSTEVQPVHIIQPVQDVVQPVVDQHIRPVHSETINAPVVNTVEEPIVEAGDRFTPAAALPGSYSGYNAAAAAAPFTGFANGVAAPAAAAPYAGYVNGIAAPGPFAPASVTGPYSASVVGPAGYAPKANVIEPKVTRVEPTRINTSEDVQPVDIIQPVQDVVQPVVDQHVKPVYSQSTNAPIVNTCVEPCTKACCNGVARRDCGCPANFCGCPTKCDVVKPAVTETKAPIVNNSKQVQPVDIIQPVQDVVQPVVDQHIRPVHSETINAPVVNTVEEPIVEAGDRFTPAAALPGSYSGYNAAAAAAPFTSYANGVAAPFTGFANGVAAPAAAAPYAGYVNGIAGPGPFASGSATGPYSVRGTAGYAPKTDVIEPKVTRVEPTRINTSEDVQPVDIIQPVQDVVQPVVDQHVKPVHSQATNAPIVKCTKEPCTEACGCNGLYKRQEECGSSGGQEFGGNTINSGESGNGGSFGNTSCNSDCDSGCGSCGGQEFGGNTINSGNSGNNEGFCGCPSSSSCDCNSPQVIQPIQNNYAAQPCPTAAAAAIPSAAAVQPLQYCPIDNNNNRCDRHERHRENNSCCSNNCCNNCCCGNNGNCGGGNCCEIPHSIAHSEGECTGGTINENININVKRGYAYPGCTDSCTDSCTTAHAIHEAEFGCPPANLELVDFESKAVYKSPNAVTIETVRPNEYFETVRPCAPVKPVTVVKEVAPVKVCEKTTTVIKGTTAPCGTVY